MQQNQLKEEQKLSLYEELSQEYSMIPVKGKKPVEYGWQQWCEAKRPFHREDFIGLNAGIATGPASGLIVLDIDNQNLFESFRLRYGYPQLPKTYTVETGGSTPAIPRYHYYFRYPDDGIRYGKKALKTLGFDLLGAGAQVLAPGSIHPDSGNEYRVVDQSPAVDLPEWLLNILTSQSKKEWSMINLEYLRVSTQIKELITEEVPKGERSEAMMKVINAMVSAGYSEDKIFYVFYTFKIGEKHIERGSSRDQQLQEEITKAREYSGTDTDLDHGDDDGVSGLEIVWGNEFVKKEYEVFPLIDGLLEEKGSLLVIGPTGIGKSIFTLNVAMAVGSAQQSLWERFAIQRPLKTVMVQAENPAAFVWQRMKKMAFGDPSLRAGLEMLALPKLKGRHRIMGMRFKDTKFRELILRIKEYTNADILIIDPLISYAGVDENNNSEMRTSLDALTDIAMQTDMSVILIHHSGKIGDQGVFTGRGASSIADWASNILVLKKEKVAGQGTLVVRNEKTRVGQSADPFYLRMDSNLILQVNDPYDQFDYSKVVEIFKKNMGSFNTKTALTKCFQSELNISEKNAREMINQCLQKGYIVSQKDTSNKNSIQFKLNTAS